MIHDVFCAGIGFYRKLLAAGVPARLLISGGTIHASEILAGVFPDLARENAHQLYYFACSL